MIGKLSLIMINVSDMERSVRFYRDALGLTVEQESPYWSQLDAGTISIGLHSGGPAEGAAEAEPALTLSFAVEDIAGAVDQLRSAGAQVAQEPARQQYGEQLAVIRDPDGHPIQLLQD